MNENRRSKGWPMWTRIASPASIVVIAIIVTSNQYVDGNTRSGLDKFNELYENRLVKTELDSPSRVLFDLAATKYGKPEQHRLVKSEEDFNSRRVDHVVGHVRRGGLWFEESFRFRNNRYGIDIISNFVCTPLKLDDQAFEKKYGRGRSSGEP